MGQRCRSFTHFTLKQNPLRYEHLAEFIQAYKPENRNERQESERFRSFTYEELLQRDKVSMDLIWLRDESLEDSASLKGSITRIPGWRPR